MNKAENFKTIADTHNIFGNLDEIYKEVIQDLKSFAYNGEYKAEWIPNKKLSKLGIERIIQMLKNDGFKVEIKEGFISIKYIISWR